MWMKNPYFNQDLIYILLQIIYMRGFQIIYMRLNLHPSSINIHERISSDEACPFFYFERIINEIGTT